MIMLLICQSKNKFAGKIEKEIKLSQIKLELTNCQNLLGKKQKGATPGNILQMYNKKKQKQNKRIIC